MPLTRPNASQVNFDIANITDPLIRLNSGQTGVNNKDLGIVLERGSDTNVAIMWDESGDTFAVVNTPEDGTTSGDVAISSYANIKANSFYGDGSNLTGLPATNAISQGDSNIQVTDAGTGIAVVTLDNATHTTFDSNGITLATGVFNGTATTAQYADLAEIYSADADISPGTVVCFGGTKEVTTCTQDADKRIAGIISTNPAYLMNNTAVGVAVALQGRVPCRVIGVITKGDMLVSAGSGMARSEENPKMGTVIGKALEDHADCMGVIEVVVGRI
jgi:hypothetical protein